MEHTEANVVGQRVIALRRARGWEQADLAEHAQVAQATVSRIESGKRRNPNSETLRRIARALDVPVDDLYTPAAVA